MARTPLLNQVEDAQFLCVRASTVQSEDLAALRDLREPRIPVVTEARYDAINAADLVWVASGTATLETGLLLKPMVIMYRLSALTYWLARLLVRVNYIGMVNLIAGERLVPELIQNELRPERIVEESEAILRHRETRASIIEKLAALRAKLGVSGASERVADLALAMMV